MPVLGKVFLAVFQEESIFFALEDCKTCSHKKIRQAGRPRVLYNKRNATGLCQYRNTLEIKNDVICKPTMNTALKRRRYWTASS